MSKELECLDRIENKNYLTNRECREFLKVVREGLQRLESIDNANPSEALKELEKFTDFYDTKYNRVCINAYNTIKQALLKAQEPKQYLKWEDLEFSESLKCQMVKMNGNNYILRYILDVFGDECCLLYDEARNHYIVLTEQFFNDLHLEVTE